MSSLRIVIGIASYFLIGLLILHFSSDGWVEEIEQHLGILRALASTAVILFGLVRLILDRLKGAQIPKLLPWFFVVFSGAVLVQTSWILVIFMGIVFLVLLLVDFDEKESEVKKNDDNLTE